ncbi:hypothetical protein N7492_002110 [Penicillium capsulatum]|uniref:Uncharacterized protein n=1 Tax=Penicillium capsulatum TaxID=69766 RepID=A0A9W9LVD4_9EURO|nr:hypothetical protein N7492_002110 [Penicillium capsulatum]KAJ6123278.1 hypothetical protein N7512_005743 [Penicillium capsulatum]
MASQSKRPAIAKFSSKNEHVPAIPFLVSKGETTVQFLPEAINAATCHLELLLGVGDDLLNFRSFLSQLIIFGKFRLARTRYRFEQDWPQARRERLGDERLEAVGRVFEWTRRFWEEYAWQCTRAAKTDAVAIGTIMAIMDAIIVAMNRDALIRWTIFPAAIAAWLSRRRSNNLDKGGFRGSYALRDALFETGPLFGDNHWLPKN